MSTAGRAAERGPRTRTGGLSWALVIIYFVVQPIVAAAWPRPYRWSVDYISDLGLTSCGAETCSPRHGLMNAGFVLGGALIVTGAVLLRPWLHRNGWTAVGTVLVVIAGIGTVVVGLVPADRSIAVHGLAAVVHIPVQAVGLLLFGIGSVRHRRGWGAFTLVCAVIALVGVVLFVGGLVGPLHVGAAERLADYPFYGWVVITGLTALVRPR